MEVVREGAVFGFDLIALEGFALGLFWTFSRAFVIRINE